MEFKKVVETRRSIRKYTDRQIPENVIRQIVHMATLSPTWKNSQTVSYIIVTDVALKEQIAVSVESMHANNPKIIRGAAALAVLVTQTGICGCEKDGSFSTSKGDRWEAFDAGIAAQTFCLAACEEGVGTVMMGLFDEEAVGTILGLAPDQKAAVLIGMGYPEMIPDARPRKSVDEVLQIR